MELNMEENLFAAAKRDWVGVHLSATPDTDPKQSQNFSGRVYIIAH